MSPKRRRSILAILAIAVVVLVGTLVIVYSTGFSSAEASQTAETKAATETGSDEAIPVRVADISRGPVSSYTSASANLVPENQVQVLAEAQGLVEELLVEEGDEVSEGAVLVRLARDEAEILLRKARLRASNAELAFKRAQGTLDQGLISHQDFDRLQMEHEVAEQEVAEAEWMLGKTVIGAPFAGRITERLVSPGQHVRPGDVLFTVADFTPLIARIYLPEKDVLELEEGREVRIALAADSSYAFAGTIRQISPVVDTATGTVKVTVEAVRPPAQVRPGAFVTIDIMREHHDAAILLPREAVIRELRTAHVFVASDGHAEKRAVTLGLEEANSIEVLSGVEEGEQVIVAGQGGLKPGAKIRIL